MTKRLQKAPGFVGGAGQGLVRPTLLENALELEKEEGGGLGRVGTAGRGVSKQEPFSEGLFPLRSIDDLGLELGHFIQVSIEDVVSLVCSLLQHVRLHLHQGEIPRYYKLGPPAPATVEAPYKKIIGETEETTAAALLVTC